jgi:hypothetical protein
MGPPLVSEKFSARGERTSVMLGTSRTLSRCCRVLKSAIRRDEFEAASAGRTLAYRSAKTQGLRCFRNPDGERHKAGLGIIFGLHRAGTAEGVLSGPLTELG